MSATTTGPGPVPAAIIDPGAGSLAAVARDAAGPLVGALTPVPLPWDVGAPAQVSVPIGARHPVLLLTLLTDLAQEQLVVLPRLAGATADEPPVTFAPWSAGGSALAAAVPTVDDGGVAAPLVLTLTATRTAGDGALTALSDNAVRAAFRVDLAQGVAAKVMTAVLGEKTRLRRTAREVVAMRALAVARADALDRIGADVGCHRFADELFWDAGLRSPSTRPLPSGTREDDASYRARLRTLRGWRLPSPAGVSSALNGDGDSGGDDGGDGGDEGRPGMLADVGVTSRVEVDESRNTTYLGLRLVAPDAADGRAALLEAVRSVHLVWPAGSAAGDQAHAGRLLPEPAVQRIGVTRTALAHWSVPAGQPVAPGLADALERLDERCGRLGARPWPAVVAGQQDEGGSRLELGLGAVLAPVDPAALDAAVAAASALGDPALVPVPRAGDPSGAWLLGACGLRTTEPLADGTVFISTLPLGPVVIDAAPAADGALPITLTASMPSTQGPTVDVPLQSVLDALRTRGLATQDPGVLLTDAQPVPVDQPLGVALLAAGVAPVVVVPAFSAQLSRVSPRLYAGFDLGPAATDAMTTDPSTLAAILAAARTAGASSAAGVLTAAGTVALFFGVVGLPVAGTNLSARQTVLLRWQARGLVAAPVQLAPLSGPTTQVYGAGQGISLVSCLVRVRGRGNDPCEWSPVPPDGALLTLRQYEHLMNLVELLTPVGVRANTWRLRREHLDVDGSGTPTPLTAAAARSYRRYRDRR